MKKNIEASQTTTHKDTFYIKIDAKYYMQEFGSINWIYAKGNHSTICLKGTKEYTLLISLNNLMTHLPSDKFIRCHRNYLVNQAKIKVYDPSGGYIKIEEKQIPVSRGYKQELESRLLLL